MVNKVLIAILSILIILLLIICGFLIYQNPRLFNKLLKNPQPSISPQVTSSEPPSNSPDLPPQSINISSIMQTQNAIKTNINAKNFQGLIPYAKRPKVNVSLMSSECCEPKTPEELVSQMSYINTGLPLDFNQESDLVKNLKSKNSQLANTFLGISTKREQLAAFTIDSDNLISEVQLAVSWKLYNN